MRPILTQSLSIRSSGMFIIGHGSTQIRADQICAQSEQALAHELPVIIGLVSLAPVFPQALEQGWFLRQAGKDRF